MCLRITDKTFSDLRDYCSDKFLTVCLENVNIELLGEVEEISKFDVTNYLYSTKKVNLIDKLNFCECFFECGGRIKYKEKEYGRMCRTYFFNKLVDEKLITKAEEHEISFPWIQIEPPYFSLKEED